MPIQCPECLSENTDNANFCNQCGARLHRPLNGEPPRRSPRDRRNFALTALLACIFLAAGFLLYFSERQDNKAQFPAVSPKEENVIREVPVRQDPAVSLPGERTASAPAALSPAPPARQEQTAAREQRSSPVKGKVTVVDPWGFVVAEFPSVVVDSGWIALPTKALIGGSNWRFRSDSGAEASFAGGLWQQGDKVGLWQLDNDKDFKGTPLAAWNPNEELGWMSTDGSGAQVPVTVVKTEAQGFFLHSPLPDSFQGPALLMQNKKVVGWSFGEVLPGAYLWNGALDTVHIYEATVADFYNQTFAGGREEQFSYALSLAEQTPLVNRLAILAEAFTLTARLQEEETPQRLRKAEIIPYLRYYAGQIHNRKDEAETVRLFPVSLLIEIGDPQFGAIIARLAADGFGYQYAIDLLSEMIAYFQQFPSLSLSELQELHLAFFRELIASYLNGGQLAQASKVYDQAVRFYPGDPGLYLSGVELAIAGEDWQNAERLLNARTYPTPLLEKEKLLRAAIARLKAREGKIVIEFPPGHSVIPTSAVLGGTLRQKFMIDTGASFVTIPSATAKQLGMQVTDANPLQLVYTAAGTFTAPEVVIPSVELGGWIVDNVRALVVDIPNQSDTGLLGLNFLNRFRMDLDTENGILLLSPK